MEKRRLFFAEKSCRTFGEIHKERKKSFYLRTGCGKIDKQMDTRDHGCFYKARSEKYLYIRKG